jgi:hypothetical protein
VHVADHLLLPRDNSLDQGEVARPASRCHSELNVSNWSLQNGCGCECTYWLIGWRLSHLNVDVWIVGMSVEVLPPVVWIVVLALVIAVGIGIGIAVGPLAVAVARVEFLDFVRGVDIGPFDIGMVRVEVFAPVVGVEVLPLVIGVAVLVVPPVVCIGVCIGIGIGIEIGIGIGIAIAIARAVARLFVKASCKHGHSIELPKAGFPLVSRVQHLCFWLVSFPWRRLCGFFCGIWVWFFFFCFWSIVYWFCLSWDTSPQEAGNSLQVRRLKATP